MKRFVEGQSRTQGVLLSESLDDFVSKTNPVRVIDVFVDNVNLMQSRGAVPTSGCRPIAVIGLAY